MTSDVIEQLVYSRKQNSVTQKEISEKLDVSQSYISKIENKTQPASIKVITRYADVMGMDLILREKSDGLTLASQIYELRHFDDTLLKFKFTEGQDGSCRTDLLFISKQARRPLCFMHRG